MGNKKSKITHITERKKREGWNCRAKHQSGSHLFLGFLVCECVFCFFCFFFASCFSLSWVSVPRFLILLLIINLWFFFLPLLAASCLCMNYISSFLADLCLSLIGVLVLIFLLSLKWSQLLCALALSSILPPLFFVFMCRYLILDSHFCLLM